MNKKTMHSRVEVHPFCEKLDSINQVLRTPDHNEVIDEKFNIIKKNSLQWIWLCLLAPFYRFFGKDVYSHVRIHRVADQVLELCEIHKSEIDRRAIKNIKKRILEKKILKLLSLKMAIFKRFLKITEKIQKQKNLIRKISL